MAILVCSIVTLGVTGAVVFSAQFAPSAAVPIPVPPAAASAVIDDSAFRDGDVLLLRGVGPIGRLSALGDDSGRSIAHCGIVAHDAAGALIMIHADAMSGLVVAAPLGREIAGAGGLDGITVLRHPNAALAGRAAASALNHARERTPFDFKYDDATDASLYCTELLVNAYAAAGEPIVVPNHDGRHRVRVPLLGNGDALHPAGLIEAVGFRVVERAHLTSTSSETTSFKGML